METMHAAGRRTLPPVPRSSAEPTTRAPRAAGPDAESDTPTERFVVDLSTGEQRPVGAAEVRTPDVEPGPDAPDAPVPAAVRTSLPAPSETSPSAGAEQRELDVAQQLVARLRAAAIDFAGAAGAESAVVREAVPPARHRRARCRIVLRYADEREVDITFLGPAGAPDEPSRHGFDRQIRRWLVAGQRRDDAWLVADPDAPDGLAIDLTAWVRAA